MARKAEWPEGMYSLVAGYVDHGESLEDTVVREVMEETAIRIKSVHYHSSQPWPFPYTLMVGFFAEAENDQITVDTHELEDAQWFSRKEIIQRLKEGSHKMPSNYSISRKLITEWFDQGNEGKLDDYL
jgi:NAD+ diphosphatase